MKIEVNLDDEATDELVKAWLKEHREMQVSSMSRPCDAEDAARVVLAIDGVLRYMMTQEEWQEFAY